MQNDSLNNISRQSSFMDIQYNQNLELIQQQVADLQRLADDHEINESKLIEQVNIY